MEVDGNKKDCKQERQGRVSVSLNPHAIVIDGNRREDGTRGERRGWWSASSNPHAMAKDRASERSDTQENTNA